MPLTPRVKKYTDYGYLITNPASENDVRSQMDGAVQEVFDIVEAGKASKVQEAWIAPTLLNGWVNFGAPYGDAKYYKDEFGIVHLEGFIKSGTVNQTCFQLPLGYRPEKALLIPCFSNGTIGVIVITVLGEVQPTVPSNNTNLSLSNASFKAV